MTISRAARVLGAGAALAVVTLAVTVGLLYWRPLPTVDGYFRLLGLHERGEVVRDDIGVPRVYATDRHDLFFLQGYVTAQDRLAQMEALRTEARRRTGPSAILAADRASSELRAVLEAYSAGVSKLIAQHADARALPAELVLAGRHPAPWEPADTLAIVGAYLERILPASVCATAPGARTLRGQPVLGADLYVDAPPPGWYEIGLDVISSRAVGASLPGVPGIVAGTNGWVAWALLSSTRPASDPAATLAALLEAMPSHGAATFAEAMRHGAIASCVADIAGMAGGTDRDQVSFVPTGRAAVLGGSDGRGARVATALDGAGGLDLDAVRTLLGPPVATSPGARVLADLGDVDTSRSAISQGISGQGASAHFGDQSPIWGIGQAHRLPLSRGAVGRTDGDLVLRAR